MKNTMSAGGGINNNYSSVIRVQSFYPHAPCFHNNSNDSNNNTSNNSSDNNNNANTNNT